MGRVSCKTLDLGFRALDARGVPTADLLAGLDVDAEMLRDPRGTMEWDDYRKVLERIEGRCGGAQGLIDLGRSLNSPPVSRALPRALRFAVSARQLYRLGGRWYAAYFPDFERHVELLEDGRIVIRVNIPAHMAGSLPYMRIIQGLFESLPRILGLSDAIVDATLSPRSAGYKITPPPTRSLFGRLRRVFELFGTSRSTVDLLTEQHDELKRSIDELRLSEERYRRLAENANDLVAEWDTQGRCTYVSPSAERILGRTQRELMSDPFSVMHPGEFDDVWQAFLTAAAEGSGRMDFQMRHKDGTWRWFENQAITVESDGQVNSIVTVSRDITEQRELELQLRQSQKMEAVGQLAGGLAHDFNNLLMVISGYAEMLHDCEKDAGAAEAAEQISEAADRAAALTRQLLAFSRKQMMQPEVIDLNVVIRDMEPLLRRLLGEHIEFVTRLAPDLGSIHADPAQMEHVIVNLVVNARDAMSKGGTIVMETANVEDPDGDGSHIELRVSDTGVGMSAELQKRIFEPFFTTKERGLGTGLGLSTVYGILQQSGAEIDVTSQLDAGSCFRVLLPCTDREVPHLGIPESRAEDVRGDEMILLVEDDASVLDVVKRGLESFGYRVLSARGSEDAQELARTHGSEIRLLISDVVMPECSGPELAEKLTAQSPQFPCLFVSGYVANEQLGHPMLKPGENLLLKPFRPETLARKVRKLLDAAPPCVLG